MISALRLDNFRSYERLQLEVPAVPLVFLVGPNGAGKTNMLEALSLLGGGRGLRAAAAQDLIRQGSVATPGEPTWVVGADLAKPPLIHKISQAFFEGTERRRLTRLDQRQVSGAELGRLIPTVSLSPQEDALFRGPVEDRRVLLDRFVQAMYPDHRGQVSAYMKALRERNALFRRAQQDGVRPDSVWLEGLETLMASHGAAVAHQRRAYLAQLATAVAQGLGPFPAASLALEGEMEAALETSEVAEVETTWQQKWKAKREIDFAAGRTLNGPHRTDLAVVFKEKAMPAATCSTGEQKALLLSLFLGQARLLKAGGIRPLLLLDEVAAHLDQDRRKALMLELGALDAQTWVTGTDRDILVPPEIEDKSAVFGLNQSSLTL